jgi:hypothetical protein
VRQSLHLGHGVIVGGPIPDVEAIATRPAQLEVLLAESLACALALHDEVELVWRRYGVAHEIGLPR